MLDLTPQALEDLIEIGRIEGRATALRILDVLDVLDPDDLPHGTRRVAFHVDAAGTAIVHLQLADPLDEIVLVIAGTVIMSVETINP